MKKPNSTSQNTPQPGDLERAYLQRGAVPDDAPLPDTQIETDDGYGAVHVPDFVEVADEGEALATAEGIATDEPLANDSI